MRSPNMRKLRGAARAIFATQTFGLNVLQLLSALDDRLVAALEAGDIRLLRSAWLLKQTGTFRLLCRQDLETKDGDGLNSALLSCEEAVRLVLDNMRAGRRSRDIVTMKAIENAIATVCVVCCRTHLGLGLFCWWC